MSKTLLILSGAAPELARRAKDMGHAVVVCDADAQAPAFAFADSCLIADVWGASECAAAAERYSRKIRRIDGVLSACDAVATLAAITQRLRLPGIPPHVAELMSDRLMVKRAFASAGIATPWHAQIFTPQELQRATIAREGLVAGPVERRGPTHDRRLPGVEDPAALFQALRAASPSERVMVEQYPEATFAAGFLKDGDCRLDGPPDWQALAARAAAALDLRDGPVVAEIAVTEGRAELVALYPSLDEDGTFLEDAIAFATAAAP
jgi:biotin carboxylase